MSARLWRLNCTWTRNAPEFLRYLRTFELPPAGIFLDSFAADGHNVGVGQDGERLRGEAGSVRANQGPRKRRMLDFLNTPTAQIIIGLTGIAVIVVIGVYLIPKVRNEWIESKPETSDLVTNFREMRDSGELSDKEYRTIKGMLADKLSRELKDSGEKR